TNLAPAESKLVQLTTRAVIGFVYVTDIDDQTSTTTTSSSKLRYAERGTGHIYEIDFGTNTETRVSGTTVAQAVSAIFGPTGNVAVVVAEKTEGTSASLHAFGATSGKSVPLPDNAHSFHFSNSNTLRYSVVEDNQTVTYEMDWSKETTSTLWGIPLVDVDVRWTDRGALVINRPSPWLKSAVYAVENGRLSRLINPEYALFATIEPSGRLVFYSYFDATEGTTVSYVLDRDSGISTPSTLVAVPEKCTLLHEDEFWCATSYGSNDNGRELINKWYRGEFVSNDVLWKGQSDGSATYMDDLSILAGFAIDTTNLTGTKDGDRLFFINKTNGALWMYGVES
ncbi:MAG: hypothetical protein WD605_02050, partial [Candidatus Paceibacterota bacterium]